MLRIEGTREQRLTAGSVASMRGFTTCGQLAPTSAPKADSEHYAISNAAWSPKQKVGFSK